MFTLKDGRDSLYQWDINRHIVVADETIKEVHFCNRTDNCSLVVEVYTENGERLANVPNILLQTDWDINVYGYTGNYTKYSDRFKVKTRSKPADYAYTETEILNWDAINTKVNAAIEEIDATVTEADTILNETKEATNDVNEAIAEAAKATVDANTATEDAIEAADNANAAADRANEATDNMAIVFSNALKETVSGTNAIRIDDISPISHNLAITANRVNLLNESELDVRVYHIPNLEVGKNYTLSCKAKDGLPDTLIINLWNYTYASSELIINNGVIVESSISFTVTEGDEWVIEADYGNITDYIENIQLEEGIVATAYTPYIEDMNSVNYSTYGKNLFNSSAAYTASSGSAAGSIVVIDEETFEWDGDYYFRVPMPLPAGTAVTVSYEKVIPISTDAKKLSSWYFRYTDGSNSPAETSGLAAFPTKTAEKDVLELQIYRNRHNLSNPKGKMQIKKLQVEIGTTKTEFEPYKEPVEATENKITSVYPTTTIVSDTAGVAMETTYNKDLNKVIADITAAITSLGGNV